jgi:hypothetical protein
MHKFAILLLLAASFTLAAFAQSDRTAKSSSGAGDRGLLSYIDFGGSSNTDGQVFTLGFSAGYQFSRHVAISSRLPLYFSGPSGSVTSGTTDGTSAITQFTGSSSGIGDPSIILDLSFPNRVLDYQTRMTSSIPVASTSKGFSTGDVLVDWTNIVSRPIGRLIPFAQIDIANTVPDTPAFILPYSAQGINTRVEGGANFKLTKTFSVGASGYDVLPSGTQHIYSRMLAAGQSGSAANGGGGIMGRSNSGNRNVFMTNSVTVGDDLTRDHGFSTWFGANLANYVDMEIAYSRSYGYDLDTVSFGVGFNIGAALRHHAQEE